MKPFTFQIDAILDAASHECLAHYVDQLARSVNHPHFNLRSWLKETGIQFAAMPTKPYPVNDYVLVGLFDDQDVGLIKFQTHLIAALTVLSNRPDIFAHQYLPAVVLPVVNPIMRAEQQRQFQQLRLAAQNEQRERAAYQVDPKAYWEAQMTKAFNLVRSWYHEPIEKMLNEKFGDHHE